MHLEEANCNRVIRCTPKCEVSLVHAYAQSDLFMYIYSADLAGGCHSNQLGCVGGIINVLV